MENKNGDDLQATIKGTEHLPPSVIYNIYPRVAGDWNQSPLTLGERSPGRHRADTQRQTTIHPHIQTCAGLFVLWEEAGAPGANKMWTEYKTEHFLSVNPSVF